MKKLIQNFRVRQDRAEILRNTAMNLTVKQKEYVKETDLINFLIDGYADRINIDENGLFLEDDEQ